MEKKVSLWYLGSGRARRSSYFLSLLSKGKGRSISEAVAKEKESKGHLEGESDGIRVKRIAALSIKD
jgi:hypothetical protein